MYFTQIEYLLSEALDSYTFQNSVYRLKNYHKRTDLQSYFICLRKMN